ncbi:MAG TPA: hypothetical protein DDY68_06250 [Porphyromonadaceae bacterium]|nr:hypothetical protein [Porphyromonadaceae bacterium]
MIDMKRHFLYIFSVLSLFLFLPSTSMGEIMFKYRVYLKDKGEDEYSKENPESFLSPEAIQRRENFDIPIDVKDIPVSPSYIEELQDVSLGVEFVSKWFNTAVVSLEQEKDTEKVVKLDFVKSIKRVWLKDTMEREEERERLFNPILTDEVPDSLLGKELYGVAFEQLKRHRGDYLHTMGYRGKGVCIAVIENGFRNVNELFPFSKTKIRGEKDILNNDTTAYDGEFMGTRILSVLAANEEYNFVGIAPDAEYVLLDVNTTDHGYPIEEDRWICAVEFADSIGADMIVSSLGFSYFDNNFESYRPEDLNGCTAFSSQAVNIGVKKGLLFVLNSGDERGMSWQWVQFPADCENVLVVGATNGVGKRGAFSAAMRTNTGKVRPNVVSVGNDIEAIDYTGKHIKTNGDCYATAIIAGLTACIKQAFPTLTNVQLIDAVKGGGLNEPIYGIGYSQPDFFKVYLNAKRMLGDEESKDMK